MEVSEYNYNDSCEVRTPVSILKNKPSRDYDRYTASLPKQSNSDNRNTIEPYNKDGRKLNDTMYSKKQALNEMHRARLEA